MSNPVTYTCDIDGYTEDRDGRERYWHCENPSIAVLPDGTQLCREHLEEHAA